MMQRPGGKPLIPAKNGYRLVIQIQLDLNCYIHCIGAKIQTYVSEKEKLANNDFK